MTTPTHATVVAIYRIESAKLIARLTRMLRDLGRAEELAQDTFAVALERWPLEGVPERPGAWLMATAKHRALDALRRDALHARSQDELAHGSEAGAAPVDEPDDVGDDLLRLLFTSCHPVLSTEARIALTLRVLGGLTTDEIARAFLVPEPTIAQRIVRAKRTLAERRVPFEVPQGHELGERLSSVLAVVYLVFNEGYSATSGDDLLRPALCEEALRLGRILATLVPGESEVHGLMALMELQASRFTTRTDAHGDPILLLDQLRGRWDRLLIGRGLAALARAEALGPLGPYGLQAALAACHARARRADETDWVRISALYTELMRIMPSPVVALNRAVAVSMAAGPAAGLELVDALGDEPALSSYHLLPAVRGDLLRKLGRGDEARRELERAAALTRNERERKLLLERAAACTA